MLVNIQCKTVSQTTIIRQKDKIQKKGSIYQNKINFCNNALNEKWNSCVLFNVPGETHPLKVSCYSKRILYKLYRKTENINIFHLFRSRISKVNDLRLHQMHLCKRWMMFNHFPFQLYEVQISCKITKMKNNLIL